MNVHMQIRTVAFYRDQGFNLKPEVSRWLTQNGCYEGPDRSFVDNDEDARPFETWHNVNDEWAIFYFNHEDMSRRFLAEFADWKPEFNIEVKHRVRTDERVSLDDIYGALAEEFMWLALNGYMDGIDFRWTVTQLSQENFDTDIRDTSLIFAFKDPQPAMVFKLTFGGAKCLVF